jgi:hypothetical protein
MPVSIPTASLGCHRHAATKVAQPSRLRVLAPSHRHPHPPNNVQQPRKYHFYHLETVKNIHAIHPSSFILHNSAKTPVISHLSLQNRHEPTPKTPAQQLGANPFPGRTRALACFRPRLAVGTDARHRASVSRTPDIVVLLKNARNNTFYAIKPPPNLAPALQPDRHRPSYPGGLSSAAIHPQTGSFVSIRVHSWLKTPVISHLSCLQIETIPHNYPTHRRQPTAGRARHSVRAAIGIPPAELSDPIAIPTLAEHLKRNMLKEHSMIILPLATVPISGMLNTA